MKTFFTIWSGQLVSMLGSQLTSFAMGVWVYSETHSVLLLAVVQVAGQAPYILLSPLAGVFADRWNRRTAMLISDSGAGLAVLTAGILYLNHILQIWMVPFIVLWIGAFNSLMWPSLSAAVTQMVSKNQYGRASGFVQLGEALPQVAGPALAGALYVSIHLGNMTLIDFATYAFSVLLMLSFVRLPNLPRAPEDKEIRESLWKQMRFGWDYITARKNLLGLLFFFLATNLVFGVMGPLITPLILDTWNASTLGFLSSLMGVGMLAGTLIMSVWGGGKRKVYTLLGAAVLSSLFVTAVGLRASIPLIAVCGVGFMFFMPFMNACSQAIWQAKVAPEVQGRVFAVRRTIAWASGLFAPLLAAPLADYVFNPGMNAGGALAHLLGPIFGIGTGRGIGVLISVLGLLSMVVAIVSLCSPLIRRVELDLPDYT
jgi:predicted MFS family arabinose efflux permease